MCELCDEEYPAIRVNVAGKVAYPRTRGELEAALGGKATARSDLFSADQDWKPEDCFCGLDVTHTAHSAGVALDFDFVQDGKKIPLHYHDAQASRM